MREKAGQKGKFQEAVLKRVRLLRSIPIVVEYCSAIGHALFRLRNQNIARE